jgi:hypothetical protein
VLLIDPHTVYEHAFETLSGIDPEPTSIDDVEADVESVIPGRHGIWRALCVPNYRVVERLQLIYHAGESTRRTGQSLVARRVPTEKKNPPTEMTPRNDCR